MGVNMRNVVMFGVKISYEQFRDVESKDEEKFDDLFVEFDKEKDDGVRLLVDGTSGEYAIIGIPIVYSEDGRYETMDIPLTVFTPSEKEIDEVLEFMKKYFPEDRKSVV